MKDGDRVRHHEPRGKQRVVDRVLRGAYAIAAAEHHLVRPMPITTAERAFAHGIIIPVMMAFLTGAIIIVMQGIALDGSRHGLRAGTTMRPRDRWSNQRDQNGQRRNERYEVSGVQECGEFTLNSEKYARERVRGDCRHAGGGHERTVRSNNTWRGDRAP